MLVGLSVGLGLVVAALAVLGGVQRRSLRRQLLQSRQQTETQRSSAAVAEAAQVRLRAALDAVGEGVVLADAAGGVVYRNPYAETFVQARHGEALVEAAVAELLVEAATAGSAERRVTLFGPPERILLVRAMQLLAAGRHVATMALINDVTEPERLDAVRRDFVANVSHELKTPIGAISLLAETMRDEEDPVVSDRLSRRMLEEALRLSDIVEDLLELSRIEHTGTLQRRPLPLQEVVNSAVGRIRATADHKGVMLDVVLPAAPLRMSLDVSQLVSAVFNLLDNAVKHSEPGQTVTVRVQPSGEFVELEVRDTGIGIPKRHQDRIFERFYRVDRARERTAGSGTGLGLSIVRHAATNHGGEVRVESAEGQGSTFTLRLPCNQPERADVGGGVGAGVTHG